MSTSPTSQAGKEPAVPTVPSPEPKRRRLNPIANTLVYDEPFTVRVRDNTQDWNYYDDMIRSWVCKEQVPPPCFADTTASLQTLPPLQYPLEQDFAAFVANMDREIGNMRDAAGEITGLLQRGSQADLKLEKLTEGLGETDATRIEELEAQLEAANAAGDAQDVEPEGEPAEIMSGRGRGGRNSGRGNINMTAAELTAIINDRVEEAVAANQATQNTGVELNEQSVCFAGWKRLNRSLRCATVHRSTELNTHLIANALPWEEFKTMLREEYCLRDEVQKLEVPQIQSTVTSSNPTTIQQTIRQAHKLTGQAVA
ncbi:hypothetical protein L1987_42568 [Smallanthus sonchifolius]|uniref:Uncharacterized protein n=1 Tax=Smallanthus sonchifolius TaxID=185202 RepID=A0ACB9GJ84_9ASTR|nr:hypothetical protein L1987_42568 [Smallanthus sonchifolius]